MSSPHLKVSSSVQRAYSSSAIVTLAGQKVYISNVSGSQTVAPSQPQKPSPLATKNIVPNIAQPTPPTPPVNSDRQMMLDADRSTRPEPRDVEELRQPVPLAKRPSISELRRAFFNELTGPAPQQQRHHHSPRPSTESVTSDLGLSSLLNSTAAFNVTPPLLSPPRLTRIVAPIDTPESSDVSAEPSPTGLTRSQTTANIQPRSLRGTGGGLQNFNSFARISSRYAPAYGSSDRKLGSPDYSSSNASR